MAAKRQFSVTPWLPSEKSKGLRTQAGQYRFTGVWVVVVRPRLRQIMERVAERLVPNVSQSYAGEIVRAGHSQA
jgi:hypothetical protein